MKSFEEFHTMQKRRRAWDRMKEEQVFNSSSSTSTSSEENDNDNGNDKDINEKQKSNSNSNDSSSDNVGSGTGTGTGSNSSSTIRIGPIIESYEVQLFIVVLIYFDLIACTITYILQNDVGVFTSGSTISSSSTNANGNTVPVETVLDSINGSSNGESTTSSILFYLLLGMLSTLMNFTSVCFVIEIIGLLVSFGVKNFISHLGYCLDAIIIGIILYDKMSSMSFMSGSLSFSTKTMMTMMTMDEDVLFPVQFLTYLRCWRIARLMSTMVSREEEEHKKTQMKLRTMEDKLQHEEMNIHRLEILNSNEVDLRSKVEQTLMIYKDEIETLKEALKIAALDVAITARDELKEQEQQEQQQQQGIVGGGSSGGVLVDSIVPTIEDEKDEDDQQSSKKIFKDGSTSIDEASSSGDEFFDGHETS